LWTPAFRKVATEIGFHPEACALSAPNQKGAVENLVGFVKHDFIPERTFDDDGDLADQQDVWLDRVNHEVSQAHGACPADVLVSEQGAFGPLTTTAADYGILHLLKVTPESVIHLATNRYSVPVAYIGQPSSCGRRRASCASCMMLANAKKRRNLNTRRAWLAGQQASACWR
jgi:hypothetical protein